jgi:UDP-N-acetylglucosamine--N-acetylmuramyl-(pentapeptide) pyrophosphoryl-undecaprenol N-acetylglucosamine transferase
MRLALTAGGTGGHIYPALSVLEAVRAAGGDDLVVRFFGPENRGERAMVERHGIAFESVPSAGVRGRGPVRLAVSFGRLAWGVVAAIGKLRRFRPDVVFSTGGYASFPCSLAARVLRKPLVVYLPDVTPGWAVRVEQRLATRIATTAEAALAHLPAGKTRVTGYPVRSEFFAVTREDARARLGIADSERVLLVAGASQGSQTLNAAIAESLHGLLKRATVLHVTGNADIAEAEARRATLAPELAARYQVAAYRDDLPVAMVAADLAIMRAGASVIGELPAACLPALLVPGTFAGGHQRDNARWLASHGAAEVIEEREIAMLVPRAMALLDNEERLASMKSAAGTLARPNAAADIAAILREVARR